jgi:DNA end-binding protein Ku
MSGKVGLGQLVVRGKSSIVCLRPHGKGLAIETLRYADEVQKADQFFAEVPDVEPEEELKSMAEELIKRKAKAFDPKVFKDPYDVALRELIQAKLEDRPPEEIDMPEVGAQVINLMDALKKSMSAESGKPTAKSRGKKTAAKSAATEKKSSAKAKDKKTGARGRRAA